MKITHLSHVAFRCNNARETVEFYTRNLGLRYHFAVAENRVPSTGAFDPHIHVFLEVAPGSYLAFFELAEAQPAIRDPNTPVWVQHVALHVETVAEVQAFKERLEAAGVDVLGVTDHGIFRSIYFFDPSGHRIEVTCETMSAEQEQELESASAAMLAEWDRTKRAPEIGSHRLPAAG